MLKMTLKIGWSLMDIYGANPGKKIAGLYSVREKERGKNHCQGE